MSRHKKGSIIIRPPTVREVDTTGLEPQIVLLRSGVFDIEDITVLEESGALQQLVDVGVFCDQRILNLFYQLILQPPSRTDMEGEEHRERRLAASRAWWARNKEKKNRERREQYQRKCAEGPELREYNRKRRKAWSYRHRERQRGVQRRSRERQQQQRETSRTDTHCKQTQDSKEQS